MVILQYSAYTRIIIIYTWGAEVHACMYVMQDNIVLPALSYILIHSECMHIIAKYRSVEIIIYL